jgi:cephalosporin hydroxylase
MLRNAIRLRTILMGTIVLATFFMLSTLIYSKDGLISSRPVSDKTIRSVEDRDFQTLKKRVISELRDSWSSAEKIELMMDLICQIKPEVCVEIGVFQGSSLLPVAATLKYLGKGHIYGIDAWSNQEAIRYMKPDDPNYIWWSKVDMNQVQKDCQKLITRWKINPFCSLIACASSSAALQVPQIDFLHLDGNFSEEGSLADLEYFLPKVRPGGYILISNLYQELDGKHSKMSSMWLLFDHCDIIWNTDHSCALFRKQ